MIPPRPPLRKHRQPETERNNAANIPIRPRLAGFEGNIAWRRQRINLVLALAGN